MPEQIVKDNRQNKKPEPQDYLLEFAGFLKTYWVAILSGLALAVVAMLAWTFFRTNRQEQQARATSMLALAQTQPQLEEIISQYPASQAASLALLALAAQQHTAALYGDAEATYNKFLTEHPNHCWANVAHLGIIQCKEGYGSLDEAATRYDAFANINADDFLAPQALLGKARCLHALNRIPEARAVYESLIVTSETNNLWRHQAEMSLALLERNARAEQQRPGASAPDAVP